jgi:hypothetical protein
MPGVRTAQDQRPRLFALRLQEIATNILMLLYPT